MNTLVNPLVLNQSQPWPNDEISVRCIQITQETHDVRSFCFAADEPLLFTFKPGQYVQITTDIDGTPTSRLYSISTPPSRPHNFSITVKRVPGGVVSNWLHESFQVGDTLCIKGAMGAFNFSDLPSRKALMLSGGSGITPVMSMSRWLYDVADDVDIHFVHSARTPSDIIYHHELQSMDTRTPNFRLSLVCEGSLTGETWSGYRGFLNKEMLEQMVPDLMERTIYICGPEPYMQAVRKIIKALDFPMDQYHEESFGGATLPAATSPEAIPSPTNDNDDTASDTSNEPTKTALNGKSKDIEPLSETISPPTQYSSQSSSLTFTKADKSVSCEASETILDVAAKNGLWVASACRMGFCGSCKVQKVSGSVSMTHSGGITDVEIEQGLILACCSYAQDDVVLEL